ncbi:LacI family transcriptional regulator [Desertihabitans brevis]|uniref:LacI family transcriptional regulator n=1 Tax=Desertihabitans brevis TaxID=2268447 RepID=A0A367YV14_9ACTN|nr:LacI family DNA-binding transcriptional regulator [Desertihabitans brevis]RCK69668.1 LacI family transcriptional regulator [Desertihabitans brevis]
MATIEDVARAAGVSVSTVSYALSGKRPISVATRERIQRAVRELDYRPHAGARALASSRTDVLALVAPLRVDVNVPVILQFVAGVVTRARTHHKDVLLLTNDDPSSLDRVVAGSMVDAVVVMDIETDDPRLPELRAMKQPAVLIGLPGDPGPLSCVDLDFAAVGRTAVQHLLAAGRRRIGLVGPTPVVRARHTSFADRLLHGYADALAEAGLEPLETAAEGTRRGGITAVAELLERHPDLDAVVVHNEGALPGVIEALREGGHDDRALLAVGPADVVAALPVDCDWIEIPAARIGELAVDMVVDRLEDGRGPEVRLLPPTLARHRVTP